jgi:hypothetical protein
MNQTAHSKFNDHIYKHYGDVVKIVKDTNAPADKGPRFCIKEDQVSPQTYITLAAVHSVLELMNARKPVKLSPIVIESVNDAIYELNELQDQASIEDLPTIKKFVKEATDNFNTITARSMTCPREEYYLIQYSFYPDFDRALSFKNPHILPKTKQAVALQAVKNYKQFIKDQTSSKPSRGIKRYLSLRMKLELCATHQPDLLAHHAFNPGALSGEDEDPSDSPPPKPRKQRTSPAAKVDEPQSSADSDSSGSDNDSDGDVRLTRSSPATATTPKSSNKKSPARPSSTATPTSSSKKAKSPAANNKKTKTPTSTKKAKLASAVSNKKSLKTANATPSPRKSARKRRQST